MSAPEPPVTDQVLDQVEATLAGTAIHGRWSKRFTCDMCGREVVYGEQARHAEACGYFIVLPDGRSCCYDWCILEAMGQAGREGRDHDEIEGDL